MFIKMEPRRTQMKENKDKLKRQQHTWITGNIHGFEIPTFDDRKCESPCSWQVAEREHYLSQIHAFLQNQMETHKIQLTMASLQIK